MKTFLGLGCSATIYYQIITHLINLKYVRDLSLGRTSRNILAPAVKDVILMAQDYTRIWLALAEAVKVLTVAGK